jgi:5-methylcytosine-specific restriction enzyme A
VLIYYQTVVPLEPVFTLGWISLPSALARPLVRFAACPIPPLPRPVLANVAASRGRLRGIYPMTKLRTLGPLVRALDTSTTRLSRTEYNSTYLTPEYRAWRAHVVQRAGGRCEAVDHHGHRCTRAWPEHRLFADHIRELSDGGSLLDPHNGQCLCASHHKRKTDAARAKRRIF